MHSKQPHPKPLFSILTLHHSIEKARIDRKISGCGDMIKSPSLWHSHPTDQCANARYRLKIREDDNLSNKLFFVALTYYLLKPSLAKPLAPSARRCGVLLFHLLPRP